MPHNFPIARKLISFAGRAGRNWLLRHQSGFNFATHLIGIPLAFAGIALLFLVEWPWGVGAIVGGYLVQWAGHRVEGNDMGEFILFKKMLGLPYVATAPKLSIGINTPSLSKNASRHRCYA